MVEKEPRPEEQKELGDTMRLPNLQNLPRKNTVETVQMGGINYSDMLRNGDITDSKNISARRFPYITTRNGRTKMDYTGATAMTSWEKLVVVEGDDLYYDGTFVGKVSAGEKQFAVVNTKLVIWPDKKYMDMSGGTPTIKDLEADVQVSGATFTKDTITVSGVDLTQSFKVGDAVEITGCHTHMENNKFFTIKSITATTMTGTPDVFTAGTETDTIEFTREVPDLDFICESENRLWGCSSETQTIYCSALGDPTNFNVFDNISTDSYAVAVGSEGDFTGCCKLSSSVLFWKENTLHKLLGSYPAEFAVYTYNIEGLRKGCHKSMQVINEVLYYLGIHGVYAYTGGQPGLISSNFGNREFTNGVSGNDGDSYYLSVKEGDNDFLFVYETRIGLWVKEDDLYCLDFTRIGRDCYMLTEDGDIFLMDNRQIDNSIEWKIQFAPFYETIQGRKGYARYMMRLELPQGSHITVKTRVDGQIWREVQKIVGKTFNVVTMRLPFTRCDKYEVLLEGKGSCTILQMLREFSLGSEV